MPDTPRTSTIQRIWKPAVATGASGTAVAVWFEEILLYAEAILALIFIPLMAGLIFLVNLIMFKSRLPTRNNHHNSKDKGAKQ